MTLKSFLDPIAFAAAQQIQAKLARELHTSFWDFMLDNCILSINFTIFDKN
jgi:hypothetical protein